MNADGTPRQPGEGQQDDDRVDEQVERIVGDVIERRAAGQVVTDEEILNRYPELAAPLRDELAALREVHRAMLAATAGSRSAGTLPVSPPGNLADEPAVAGSRPNVPGYVLLRELGRGAQAVVYVAIQESTGRKVAVKLVGGSVQLVGMHDRHRFNREADVLAALDHPHVVKIVDRGRATDGSLFFAMDHVDGPALDAWLLDRRTRSNSYERDVAALFAKIARALHEVHGKGVIHRDLKPTNVRVDRLDEPHVLDFGLARLLSPLGLPAGTNGGFGGDGAAAVERFATVTGQIIGSLPWASPEQATGAVDRVDARSDVYALGIMLYHALAGEFPYPVDVEVRHVLHNITTRKPATPIRLAYRNARRCDRVLESIVLRAIAKEPASRYPSAAALGEDLEAWLAGKPVDADERRKHRRFVMLAGLVVGALVASAAGILGWAVTRPTPPVVFARPSFTNTLGVRLIQLPPATIRIGSPEREVGRHVDEEQATVRIERSFWMGTTEVTRGQYRAVMGRLPEPPEQQGWTDPENDQLPVTSVTWDEAVQFCRRLSAIEKRSYRLPSEAEWEYAARAGQMRPFSGSDTIDEMGWYAGNSGNRLHEVAAKWPNHLGFHDVHGNAAEWCDDVYRTFYRAGASLPQTLPAGFSPRVIRGGHAQSAAADCRSARRESAVADWAGPLVGFRIVLDDPAPAPPGP